MSARRALMHVMHVNTGSCNGCDVEVRRLVLDGVDFVDSVEDADVIVFTGPTSSDIKDQVMDLLSQVSEKKVPIVAVGSCALSGGICYESEAVEPVLKQANVYVFGCPPNPFTILEGAKIVKKERRVFRWLEKLLP